MSIQPQFHRGTCYRLTGQDRHKPVVVLIHGVGLSQDMWQPWVGLLSPSHAVLTYDLFGHGHSANPEGPRTAHGFVTQLMDLVDHLGIDRFALIGFSLGAVITQATVSLYGSRLTHAVFLHSTYRRTHEQCEAVRERYRITRDQGPMVMVELALRRWFSEQYIALNPDKMDDIRRVFSQHKDDGYLKAYYFFCHAETEMKRYSLNHFDSPALVITGAAETGSTAAMSQALSRDLPHSELTINPGHYHMAPVEHAGLLVDQVLTFLNKHQTEENQT